jgi:hypothetical protein
MYSMFVLALLTLPTFYGHFVEILSSWSLYTQAVAFVLFIWETIVYIWTIAIAILLIKNNSYTKQLFYLVNVFAIMKISSFALRAPLTLQPYMFVDLAIGILVYFFFIYHNNKVSRIVLNK